MLLSAVSVLVVAQSSWEIPEGLMDNPVFGSQKMYDISVAYLGTLFGRGVGVQQIQLRTERTGIWGR